MQMSYGRARFVLERCKVFQPENPERKALRSCGLSPEQGGGVLLEGTQKNIDAAHLLINEVLYSMVDENHIQRNPGIRNYYLSGGGKDVIDTASRLNNCIILLDTPNCQDWVKFNSERTLTPAQSPGSSVDIPRECLASVKLGHVTLSVWKVDIIQHRCDVIINTSNKELQLLPGGVSGVIKKYDMKNANQIQKDMNKIITDNYGHLSPGDTCMTRAGNLPKCRMIAHVVGPRWNDEAERRNHPDLVLKSCVRGSLEETEKAKLQSIAIPAISCGVFGGRPEICIPSILDAVLDYFQQNTASCIKKIDFVELSNSNVLNEFKQSVSQVGGTTVKQPKVIPQPMPRAKLNPSSATSSTVNLVQGDIAQQNADVIVNIMAENQVQNMASGSAISKTLASHAGASVVRECARHQGTVHTGNIFSTSAGSLQCSELYHGLIASYSHGSKAYIVSVVQQCLQLAAKSNYRSIAFPAIGTGGFKHPPDKVAQWMRSTIEKYAGNLQVSIVLYPSNSSVIAAFIGEFTGTPQQSSHPRQSAVLSSSVAYGPLILSVTQGDITQQQVDAIVNSTNSSFDLTQGMISAKILQQGGVGIQTELQNASGEIAVTSGGNLPCRHVLHLVTPSDEKDLQKKIVNLLRTAEVLKLSSIAIPALGTGNIKMDSSTVGLLFRSAFQAFVQSHPSTRYLKTVDVVIYDASMIQDFKDALLSDTVTRRGKFKKIVDGFLGFFKPSTGNESPEEILNLYFYAASRNDIQKALKLIESETSKVMHKELIDDPILSSVTAMETFEIEEIGKKNRVKIENRSDVYLVRLQVVGLTKDVLKVCDSIRSVLRQLSEAKTCVQYIAWEKRDSGKRWTELPARAAHGLEKAYQKNKKQGRVQVKEFQYDQIVTQTYDLATMGGPSPQIRRRLKEGESALPSTWDDMGGASFKQVTLNPGSAEYNKVITSITSTGLNPKNPKIERIQSVALYKQYAAKKAEVTEKLQGTGIQVERKLFHGTTSADKIINNGFDRSYAGAHATAFGVGVYFATTAHYSHGYAQPGANNIRTMFLANVITGAYAQGAQGMKTPPARTGIDLFDSVVNNVSTPTMYVIFKDASAYPTYLVSYTC